MHEHLEKPGVAFLVAPSLRFAGSDRAHQTMMVADPSGNVVEFKCYTRPECSY